MKRTGSLGAIELKESGWFLIRAIADVSGTFHVLDAEGSRGAAGNRPLIEFARLRNGVRRIDVSPRPHLGVARGDPFEAGPD